VPAPPCLRASDRSDEARTAACNGVSASIRPITAACTDLDDPKVLGSSGAVVDRRPGVGQAADQVELATLDYVDWYNHQRLYETCGDIPPAELETAYYRQNTSLAQAG
jgi:putative transposase